MFKFVRLLPMYNIDGGASSGGDGTPAAGDNGTGGQAAPAAQPSAVTQPAAPTAPTQPENPLRTGRMSTAPATQEPGQQPPAVPIVPAPTIEEIDWAGRKVIVTDPVIKDLHRDYTNLNGAYTQATQRTRDLEGQVQAMQQIVTNLQAIQPQGGQPPATQPTQPAEPTQERLQEINDKYWEMAHENKLMADKWLMEQPEYQQMMQPLQQKHVESVLTGTQQKEQALIQQAKEVRGQLEHRYPDFRDLVPQMQQVLEKYPHLAQQFVTNPTAEVLESTYWMAKGMGGGGTSQPPNPSIPAAPAQSTPQTQPPAAAQPPSQPAAQPQDVAQQLLQDQNFLAQIASNPQIQQLIISNYVKGVNTTQTQVPLMIGTEPGGQPPSSPPFQPNTVKEAGKGFRAFLNRNQG